jgi:hypothetical protein
MTHIALINASYRTKAMTHIALTGPSLSYLSVVCSSKTLRILVEVKHD